MTIPSLRKAAILLHTLGDASADALLRQLEPTCVEAVTAELGRLQTIDPAERQRVVDELKDLWHQCEETSTSAAAGLAESGASVPQTIPDRSAGAATRKVPQADRYAPSVADDSNEDFERRCSDTSGKPPFHFLKHVPLSTLRVAIGQEQPRVIAFVLSYLPSGRAARVLEHLPEPLQHEVVRFMTTPASVQPPLRCEIEQRLRRRIDAVPVEGQRQADGVANAARLLNRTDRSTAGRILAGLQREDPELAARLHRRRWSFENLADLDDAILGVVVGHMEPADLALALKGASPRFCKRSLRLLPKGVARQVKGHLKTLGPVRLSDIETAQAYLMALVEEVGA